MSKAADLEEGRDHPQLAATAVQVDLPPDELELLDLWIASNATGMTRPEALRRILKLVAVRMPSASDRTADLPHLEHELPTKPIGGDGGNY